LVVCSYSNRDQLIIAAQREFTRQASSSTRSRSSDGIELAGLACALGGLLVGSGVELVYLAIPVKPADRRTALFERDEAAIGAAASTPVNRAPFIGIG
jgi:hypothetical protein